LIAQAIPSPVACIAAMDCSFIPKSGKATYGLDWFYDGCASRTDKGLEVSVIAVVNVAARRAYSLSVQQTPAQLQPRTSPVPAAHHCPITQTAIAQAQAQLQALPPQAKACSQPRQRIARANLEQVQAQLQQLPNRRSTVQVEPSRIDHYIEQLQQTRPHLAASVKYLVVDGFYSKQKFVDAAVALKLEVVGKLRVDANLRYLYEGQQQPRGAKRHYEGKVALEDLRRWHYVKQIQPCVHLYTAVVWHVSLKRRIRVACLVDSHKPSQPRYILLFTTDVEMEALQIVEYYQARFQIEFIFRDSKQFTGLCDGQTRSAKRLDYHFNASLSALNLAKYQQQLQQQQQQAQQSSTGFSMTNCKRIALNEHLLERFISKLELDPTLIKSHPNYENLLSYGIIAS
jgi:hypothetical protein